MRVFFLLFFVLSYSCKAEIKLPICGKKQDKSKWCWAACTQDMAARRGKDIPQSEIVLTVKSSKEVNEGGEVDDALTACGIPGYRKSGRMSGSEVRDHLENKQTVAALLRFPGQEVGHFVILFGISQDNQKFWVWDPHTAEEKEMTVKEITSKWGKWESTHYSKAPASEQEKLQFPRHQSKPEEHLIKNENH